MDSLMLKQRHGQSLTSYVHFMRQTLNDYNATCELIDGSAPIHPRNMGMLLLRGIASDGPFGQAKQCVINAFDTNNLTSADEVMAIILVLELGTDSYTEVVPAPQGGRVW
jgi:hypothetical protein